MYNLAAQSHVQVSFDLAEYTADVDGTGTLRLLDAIRTCGLEKSVRFYQASTSEMYGRIGFQEKVISEVIIFPLSVDKHAPSKVLWRFFLETEIKSPRSAPIRNYPLLPEITVRLR